MKLNRQLLLKYGIAAPWPFNALADHGVMTDTSAPKDKERALMKFLRATNGWSEAVEEIFMSIYRDGGTVADPPEDFNNTQKKLVSCFNKRELINVPYAGEYFSMAYGISQHGKLKKLVSSGEKYEDFKIHANNKFKMYMNVIASRGNGKDVWGEWFNFPIMNYVLDAADISAAEDIKKALEYFHNLYGFNIPIVWNKMYFKSDAHMDKWFDILKSLYLPDVYNEDGTMRPIHNTNISILRNDIPSEFYYCLYFRNIPWVTNENLAAGRTNVYSKFIGFDTDPEVKKAISLPYAQHGKDILNVYLTDWAFGNIILGAEGYQNYMEDIKRIEEERDTSMDDVSPILPNEELVNSFRSIGINSLEDLSQYSIKALKTIYDGTITASDIELLRYKMRDANIHFMSHESFKHEISIKDPKDVNIVMLYAADVISGQTFSNIYNTGRVTVDELDGMVTNNVIMTVGQTKELDKIEELYKIKVYATKDDLEKAIYADDNIPIKHIMEYLGYDISKQRDIFSRLHEYCTVKKWQEYITLASLRKITFKTFFEWDDDDKMEQVVLFLKDISKIDKLNFFLRTGYSDMHDNKTDGSDPIQPTYPREVNSDNSFFKYFNLDKNSNGEIDYAELEEYVIDSLGLKDLNKASLPQDPSAVIKTMTDLMYYMPDMGRAIFDFDPNSDSSYAIDRDVVAHSKIPVLRHLKDILLGQEGSKFAYLLIMLLIRFTDACREADSIDPFKANEYKRVV